MIFSKALLKGLIGASLCMANISGIVTDTGTTPISGAVVLLEKGGQTETTGSDGRFTLIVGSTAILPGNGRLLPNGLSARISDNLLTVSISERAAVEVETFDLNGKSLSIVRQTMATGTHSIVLPQRNAGIYLYRVKAGHNEFVIKGNSVNAVSSMSAVSSQNSSSNSLAKQVMSTAAINDVIASTKTEYLNYRVVAYNSDTTGIQIKMIPSAGTLTDADGNAYQTVKIGNQVWTVEDFRTTKYNDSSSIYTMLRPSQLEYCTWGTYVLGSNRAWYNWYVVNTAKFAPVGWHVPTDAEWDTLQNYLIAHGYNYNSATSDNKIAKSMAAMTDWQWTDSVAGVIGNNLSTNNSSGFSARPNGFCALQGSINYSGSKGFWWSSTEYDSSSSWYRTLYNDTSSLLRYRFDKRNGVSVRLVRD